MRFNTILLSTFFAILFTLSVSRASAQCCSNGINLLAAYNTDFSAPITGSTPPGFFSDNTYSLSPGIGNYSVIVSRNYGSCSSSPEYDHTFGTASGQYLWYDTKPTASISTPGIAWKPFNPSKPIGKQDLISVKANTTYIFSAWVRDIAREVNCKVVGAPLVGFRINGVDMLQLDLGTVPGPCCPDWINMCVSWNSGNDTTALLHIESRLGINFTDLGIDDVFFGESAINVSLGNDTTLCPGQSLLLQKNISGATYLWSDGSTGNSLTATAAGQYWVEIKNAGCTGRDTINVSAGVPPTAFSLGKDSINCAGQPVTLIPSPVPTDALKWQDNSSNNSFTAPTSGKYWLSASNVCGTTSDTINVKINLTPVVTLPSDTILCDAPDFSINAQVTGQGTPAWSNGSSGTGITVNTTGHYTLILSNECGTATDYIQVTFYTTPVLPFKGFIKDVCDDSLLVLDAQNEGKTYEWSTGGSTRTITPLAPGIYSVTISNNGSCAITDEATIKKHSCKILCHAGAPNAFSPDKNGTNDLFRPLFNCGLKTYTLLVYSRWGEKVFETADPLQGWDGSFKGQQQPMGTYVYFCTYGFVNSDKTETLKGNITLIR